MVTWTRSNVSFICTLLVFLITYVTGSADFTVPYWSHAFDLQRTDASEERVLCYIRGKWGYGLNQCTRTRLSNVTERNTAYSEEFYYRQANVKSKLSPQEGAQAADITDVFLDYSHRHWSHRNDVSKADCFRLQVHLMNIAVSFLYLIARYIWAVSWTFRLLYLLKEPTVTLVGISVSHSGCCGEVRDPYQDLITATETGKTCRFVYWAQGRSFIGDTGVGGRITLIRKLHVEGLTGWIGLTSVSTVSCNGPLWTFLTEGSLLTGWENITGISMQHVRVR
jgi:hypothetical protein